MEEVRAAPPKKPLTMCDKYWYCPDVCAKRYLRKHMTAGEEHVCWSWWCTRCERMAISGQHQCYIRGQAKPKSKASKYLYFDIETTQLSAAACRLGYSPSAKKGCKLCFRDYVCKMCRKCTNCQSRWCGNDATPVHKANYITSRTMCDVCYDNSDPVLSSQRLTCTHCGTKCDACVKKKSKRACFNRGCGGKTQTFSGSEALEDFCKFLFTPNHANYTVVSHNGVRWGFF